ncbi:hypothetical protein P691DRAFT_116995 [Macrolepiota fuliginosa MF-IS2]|uniref:Uncharacterized protein n=1 Tax=Macrolepiota fuliginosa MF-IS2 TaxID=1400762 RepID=A0A9P6C5Z8_9AGAR|nr:hypothetical protein P691DRAFT_116995 [Macrolepiota fuliginosa MF-IS2]
MLFGMYGVKEGLVCGSGTPPLIDGLLCDVTVRGIERWIAEIGEPRAGLEPAERIAEPTFISALLSLVLSIRNKLSALGYSNAVPKDPFLHPYIFTSALSSYISSTTTYNSPTSLTSIPSPPPMTSHHTINHPFPISPLALTVTTAPFAAAAFLNPGSSISHVLSPQPNASTTNVNQPAAPAVLTKELVDSIEAAYLKRVASMNENDGAGGLIVSPVTGITGVGTNVSTTTLGGLRDSGHALGGGSGSGIAVPSRRKVKSVLKGKLEDLTSVVTNDHDDGPGDGARDDRGGAGGGGGTLSGGEADGNLSVGSSGGQLFRGVGSLLLSGASGIAALAGGGTSGVWDVNVDLERFVGTVVEKEGRRKGGRSRRKKGGKASESVDFGRGNLALGLSGLNRSATALPTSLMNGDHGAIVSMLWSGRVADVVALREWEKERERVEILGGVGSASVVSDGEEARSEGIGGRSTEGEDSDAQMEGRPGGSFGGVWSERMGKKFGNWTGLSKKKGIDVMNASPAGSIGRQGKGSSRFSLVPKSPSSSRKGKERAQSPTLHPVPNSGDLEQDEMMLESGQVSPMSDYRPNPFSTLEPPRSQFYDASRDVSVTEFGRSGSSNASNAKSRSHSTDALAAPLLGPAFEFESNKAKSYAGSGTKRWGKRPVHQNRLASWSDTRSTWGYDSGIYLRSRKRRPSLTRANTMLDRTEEAEEESEILDEREVETDIDGWKTIRPLSVRRRSYHDLNSLRSMKVLSPDRMRIDVELCAQILIMTRREEHLQNVFACLEALTSTLHTTNSLLRGDYELHKDAILEIDRRGGVVSEIDAQVCNTDRTIQATNTLQYESAQFLIPDLWHTASLSRKKVLELREKVFGAGGRRLPSGKHGAHGRFNRVQWTLDGERRLVDYLGRTESEAEQEDRVKVLGVVMRAPPSEDEEENVVEHPSIKPMWLLRFFTSWGARWNGLMVGGSTQAAQAQAQGNGQDGTVDKSTAPVESAGEEIARKVD